MLEYGTTREQLDLVRPHLPPIVTAANAGGRLDCHPTLKELARFGQKGVTKSRQGYLHSISGSGTRANERAAEVDISCDCGFLDSSEDGVVTAKTDATASPASRQATCHFGLPLIKAAYEDLVKEIDSSLCSQNSLRAVQQIRKDDLLTEIMKPHAARYYKLTLPNRPTRITVTLTRSAGVTPALWGSTSYERPSAKSHDFKGKQDMLTYNHAILDDTGDASIDRRRDVPPCRELYVSVEALAGESHFTLVATFTPIKVKLTRAEMAAQVLKNKNATEARLMELLQEPAKRLQFERHLQAVHTSRTKAALTDVGSEIVRRNVKQAKDATPERNLLEVQKQALKNYARQDDVQERRAQVERAMDRHNQRWLSRHNDQREQRQAEELDLEQRRHADDLSQRWLVALAVNAFANRSHTQFRAAMYGHEMTKAQLNSATLIQRKLLPRIVVKRRKALYENVTKFRLACTAVTRTVQPAVMCLCQPIVHAFLQKHASNRDVPSLSGAVGRFRGRVIQIQGWFMQVMLIRRAFVSLLTPFWQGVQDRVYASIITEATFKELAHVQARQALEKESQMKEENRRVSNSPDRRGSASLQPNIRRTSVSGMRRSSNANPKEDKKFMEMRQEIEKRYDKLPEWLVRMQLYDYVMQMQREHQQRVADWEKKKEQAQWEKDLQGFMDDSEERKSKIVVGRRPGAIYKDEAEIEALVRDSIQKWADGNFKHFVANRRRILSNFFELWKRAQKSLAENFVAGFQRAQTNAVLDDTEVSVSFITT